jgi:hypothetical protein
MSSIETSPVLASRNMNPILCAVGKEIDNRAVTSRRISSPADPLP